MGGISRRPVELSASMLQKCMVHLMRLSTCVAMRQSLTRMAMSSITPSVPLGHRIGAADAPVKLEGWYDFACPFSAKSFLTITQQVLPAYERTAPGRLQFLHYQYPQPWHAPGAYAAEAL